MEVRSAGDLPPRPAGTSWTAVIVAFERYPTGPVEWATKPAARTIFVQKTISGVGGDETGACSHRPPIGVDVINPGDEGERWSRDGERPGGDRDRRGGRGASGSGPPPLGRAGGEGHVGTGPARQRRARR